MADSENAERDPLEQVILDELDRQADSEEEDGPYALIGHVAVSASALAAAVRAHLAEQVVDDATTVKAVRAYRTMRNAHGHMNSAVHFECMRAALTAALTPEEPQ